MRHFFFFLPCNLRPRSSTQMLFSSFPLRVFNLQLLCVCNVRFYIKLNQFVIFRWFKDYSELDYARSGNEATSDVTIDAGIVEIFTIKHENHECLRCNTMQL